MKPRAVAILPLDRGSVGFSVESPPGEFVTKHTDGELLRLDDYSPHGGINLERRDEMDVTWYCDGIYEQFSDAAVALADEQAFGYRLDGDSATIAGRTNEVRGLVEFEPLDLGGIIVDDLQQLPLVFHTVDGVYLRVRHDRRSLDEQRDDYGEEIIDWDPEYPEYDDEGAIVVDRREGPFEEWEVVDAYADIIEASTVIEIVADRAGFATSAPSAEAIQETIESPDPEFVEATIEVSKDLTTRLAIQDKSIDYADRD